MTRMNIKEWQASAGSLERTSDWITVDQSLINLFADATHDHQFIHVDEARAKAKQFTDHYQKSLPAAVRVLKKGLEESLTYFRYPAKHWSRIRTNNPLERLLREVKRRLKVVSVFPDVESALMLATARLKWTQERTWSQKRYLGMEPESGEGVA